MAYRLPVRPEANPLSQWHQRSGLLPTMANSSVSAVRLPSPLFTPTNHISGHLHDGGVDVKTYQNKKTICDSKATYSQPAVNATKSSVKERAVAHGNEDMPHIEDMSYCSMMGSFSKGDKFYIDAAYDFEKHMGMKANSGNWAEIMGIAILYVAI